MDWNKFFEHPEGPIPSEGIKRTFFISNQEYENIKRYIDGENKFKEKLLFDNLGLGELIDLCAGLSQFQQMALEQLASQRKIINDWLNSGLLSIDLVEEAQEMLKQANVLMDENYQLGLKDGKSIAPRKGAEKRHQENRAMKADVFKWLEKNMSSYKSMDKAAEHIAKNVVPVAFRTARAWVGEWKKLRAASTA
ncbi:MAG: hypothetical protein KIG95_08565 [Comamonas sp.]|nr:hypothetical protein [Comamonas sp.]